MNQRQQQAIDELKAARRDYEFKVKAGSAKVVAAARGEPTDEITRRMRADPRPSVVAVEGS